MNITVVVSGLFSHNRAILFCFCCVARVIGRRAMKTKDGFLFRGLYFRILIGYFMIMIILGSYVSVFVVKVLKYLWNNKKVNYTYEIQVREGGK